MATTSPDNIFSPDAGDAYALTSDLDAMADSVQTALTDLRSDIPAGLSSDITALENTNQVYDYRPADSSALAAVTGMRLGDRALQVDTGIHFRYNGSAWKAWESNWITYTATLSGTTVGTGGTHTGRYRWEQGRVRVQTFTVLGSSGFTFGGYSVTLPVTAATPHSNFSGYVSSASFEDVSSGNSYEGFVAAHGTSTTQALVLLVGTNGLRVGPHASTPFTWAAGDKIKTEFVYDPA